MSKVQPHDKGCDGVIRRRAIYANGANDGSQTFDAIGRAWTWGLLGDGDEAVQMRDAGRRVAARYWVAFGNYVMHDSLAKYQPRDAGGTIDPDAERRAEAWLNGCLRRVDDLDRAHRLVFDAVVIDVNPDHGPPQLDRIIWQTKRCVPLDGVDVAFVARLVAALGVL